MALTAQFCRDEEARQRDVSLNAPLPSVRDVAARAAIAWAREASLADRREARTAARQDAVPAATTRAVLVRFGDDLLSENPDRNRADR